MVRPLFMRRHYSNNDSRIRAYLVFVLGPESVPVPEFAYPLALTLDFIQL